jgi:hypothetical protein
MPTKKAKKVPIKIEPVECQTWSLALSLPDLITSGHENNTSTDTLQLGASPGIISLANSDSDFSNF